MQEIQHHEAKTKAKEMRTLRWESLYHERDALTLAEWMEMCEEILKPFKRKVDGVNVILTQTDSHVVDRQVEYIIIDAFRLPESSAAKRHRKRKKWKTMCTVNLVGSLRLAIVVSNKGMLSSTGTTVHFV